MEETKWEYKVQTWANCFHNEGTGNQVSLLKKEKSTNRPI
jgi:hypothetical protein